MINITFNPSLAEIGRRIGAVDIPKFLETQIRNLALRVERESKKQTPVDRGQLRNSISTDLFMGGAVIQPHVPYASWIHEGHMNRGGRTVRIRGLGRGGTPAGGKPYMELGTQLAIPGFEGHIGHDLEQWIQLKIR